tara:strand:- start:4613 stop:5158 length:546 start_codon:yes stop_codon:yes gene_type:complete
MKQNIISNCPLCGEHSLHLSDDKELQMMQCVSCGYVSSNKFLGTKEDNYEYQKLDKLLQSWVKETDGRLWIPIQLTLPFGMLYPALVDNEMKWVYSEMIDIPEEEQKNYPIPDQEGKFYKQKYETDNPEFFDKYSVAFRVVQDKLQELTQKAVDKGGIEKIEGKDMKITELKLPKLKKMDD